MITYKSEEQARQNDTMARESQNRWIKENTMRYGLKVSKLTDLEMIEHLEKHRPVNAYLKGLVRQDMEKHKD